jgi:hypothetical protein
MLPNNSSSELFFSIRQGLALPFLFHGYFMARFKNGLFQLHEHAVI